MLILVPLLAIYLLYRARLARQKEEWLASRRYTTLSLLVPKENEKGPLAAEQMFAALHGIYKESERWQEQISFEIVSRNKYIQFYLRTPEYLKDFVTGQIYAQYPNVEIFESPDYSNDDWRGKAVVGTELNFTKPDVYPIKTFLNFEVDPMAALTSVLGHSEEEEQIWIQTIIRPVPDHWQMKGIRHVSSIRAGKPTGGGFFASILRGLFDLLAEVIGTFTGRVSAEGENKTAPIKLSAPQEAALKAVETKVTKLGFATKIRILALAPNEMTARARIEAICGAYKQFNTINLNGFEIGKLLTRKDVLEAYQKRSFSDSGNVLNIEELASLFHLPTLAVVTPNIVWAGSKKGEPPSNLPIKDSVKPEDLTIFGRTDFRNLQHYFGIKRRDRRLHMYAIGKTGTGKSTMLENMIIDDIRKGKGVAVVDPHGELINHVLNFIPKERTNDIVYFNPADKDYPIGFNPLESVDPDLKNIIASGVVGIFKKIFGQSWGPRLEYILRNTILALLDYPGSTLLGIMRVLTDKNFRKKVIEKINDPVIKDFFVNEYEKYDPKFRTEAIAPIQNKVGQFLSSSTIRNIVGQPKSTIDIEKIMNEGKILLIDLTVGKIGEDNSALLGSMLITKIQLAAMRRANIPEAERLDFYLYVDEFQNFATESFAVILSEARKYRLNLILTNQYIAQMPEIVAKAVFGNVGSIISFRVGAQDSSFLIKEFEPVFTANDLVNLDNYHIYIKMAIDGVTRPAFSAITLSPAKGGQDNREVIIKESRERYSTSREKIEGSISEWSENSMEAKEEQAVQEGSYTRKKGSFKKPDNLPQELSKTDYRIFTDKKNRNWYLYEKKSFVKTDEEPIERPSVEVKHQPILAKEVAKIHERRKGSKHLVSVEEATKIAVKRAPAGSHHNKATHPKIEPIDKEKIANPRHLKAGESIKLN